MTGRFSISLLAALAAAVLCVPADAQRIPIYQYERENANILFFDKNLSQYIPHMVRKYENGIAYHEQIWQTDSTGHLHIQPPMMLITDWTDDGNGGASAIPTNFINICMAPMNFSYFISPSTERYDNLFRHEYTHTIMADKTASADRFWRKCLGGKFTVDSEHPFSALWSYLSAPRWYAPRWYHEGIACFMETWTGGGVGRALGGYDEMYFRSIIDSGESLYSVVGLEMEGTTSDFQVGANSYLYGTRFVNYIAYKYGTEKLIAFYDRTEDSKTLFNKQFEKVYGRNIREVWNEWREFEAEHQREQFAAIEEYPVTKTEALSASAMGSTSPMVEDFENNCVYIATNAPGALAHIERIDLTTLKREKLHLIDQPMLYQTCYLTLDKKRQRLIWTTQNNKFRGLRVYDLKEKRIVKKLDLQRVSCPVYDNANDCLYGLFTNAGVVYLCRYDSNLENREILYSFPFGLSVFDLDVSHNGKWLTATTSGNSGEQSLIRFSTEELNSALFRYETLYTFEDSNLGQFKFTPDDSAMVGSSYYTGVSNIWKLDLETKEMSLLSNTRIGLFSPVQRENGEILALEFERNGMRPVRFKGEVLEDANAITLLGQKAYSEHPKELEALTELRKPVKEISFGEVYDSIKLYKPFRNLRFIGAYPEISGFTDRQAWNNVTPVVGYRFAFSDPIGLHSLKFSIGLSPWSHNDAKNQYHAQVEWKYWSWTLSAAWNPTSFYDLFGPIRTSRKGWNAKVAFDRTYNLIPPVEHQYGASIAAYGMMDALPTHQEVSVSDSTNAFQTAQVYYKFSKTRSSLGAVGAESGVSAGINASTYLVKGVFYPAVNATCSAGFLLPYVRNTSLWFHGALGHNFGDEETPFGNDYFGGFGNNWVDNRSANRYRSITTMPGANIDAIKAHSFGKLTAELCLKPIRFKNFGLLNLYPTYTQFNLFSSGLLADPWGRNKARGFINVGAQVNTEVVMFKYLKTTWSLGYARIFNPDGTNQGDWLFSLKLL